MSWFERKLYKSITFDTDFTPVWSCGGSMVFTTDPTVGYAKYQQINNVVYFTLAATAGTLNVDAGASPIVYFTIPAGITTTTGTGACTVRDGDGTRSAGDYFITTSNRVGIYKEDHTNFTAGATFEVRIFGRALAS